MDFLHHPYTSKRHTIFAQQGMVATSQPLAAQAGLHILRSGGNAIDAAIATAAALTVVEPTSNGIGGDAFAIVSFNNKLYGLNASGPAPRRMTLDEFKQRKLEQIPTHGILPVTIPGAPASWAALVERFGNLTLAEVLQPAIDYAEKGYPLTPILGKYWKSAYEKYKDNWTDPSFENWFHTFAPKGRAPEIGEVWKSPEMAQTLRSIGETNAESFYKGELAEAIIRTMEKYDGLIEAEDLANYQVEWTEPIQAQVEEYEVWELPPNGHGIVTLMALNIFKQLYDPSTSIESAEAIHYQIESMKLAFADAKAYLTDLEHMPVTVEQLLSEAYATARAQEIVKEAAQPTPFKFEQKGTVYLATADDEGNMVSFIQSNYQGFGSGIVVEGTGIALQNRGCDFSLDPKAANVVVPGKKTYHTIIPGFLTKQGKPVGPFGVMGGYMQPQGHFQVVLRTIYQQLNPQAALDAPRWQWMENKKIMIEATMDPAVIAQLTAWGHDIEVTEDGGPFGRGQIIWKDEHGVYQGGTESRTDGSIAAY